MNNKNFYLILIAILLVITIFLLVFQPASEIEKYKEQIQIQNSIIKDQNQRIQAMSIAGEKALEFLYDDLVCPNYQAGSLI